MDDALDQPRRMNHRSISSIVNRQSPQTTNHKPTTNHHKPTTNNHKPTTNNQQPLTNNRPLSNMPLGMVARSHQRAALHMLDAELFTDLLIPFEDVREIGRATCREGI